MFSTPSGGGRCTMARLVSAIAASHAVMHVAASASTGSNGVPLHCCFAPRGWWAPLILACDASENDKIATVPVAALTTLASPPWAERGKPGGERPVCGREESVLNGPGTEDVSGLVQQQCVGQKSCEVTLPGVPWPAHHVQQEIVLRWTCSSDSDANMSGADASRVQHGHVHGTDGVATPLAPVLQLPPLPLHTEGSLIVDAAGKRVRMQGVNWAGGHITGVPAGLDRAPLAAIARRIRKLGFNLVRLTFSVQLVLTNPVPNDALLAANPQLVGMPAVDVLFEVAKHLGRAGVMVLIDDHMLDEDWCCDQKDCNGFWFNQHFSEKQWIRALKIIAHRSLIVPAVVGIGLHNEPRSICGGQSWGGQGDFCNASFFMEGAAADACVEMRWADGPQALQWKLAAERAGREVLQEHPHLLISVGGLDYCADLTDFGQHPVQLPEGRVIYEAHEYQWFTYARRAGMKLPPHANHTAKQSFNDAKDLCTKMGSQCSGITCSGEQSECVLGVAGAQPVLDGQGRIAFVKNYGEDLEGYADSLDKHWGYLVRENLAPVMLSEFGFGHQLDAGATAWVGNLTAYVTDGGPLAQSGGLDWAYWEIAGEQEGGTSREAGSTESYGVFNHCFTAPAYDSHFAVLQKFMTSTPKNPRAQRRLRST